jgi:hypothetical protein
MRVIAVERGDRPVTMTKARIIAPQAVKFLASLLEDEAFADQAGIVLDWKGDLSWSGDGEMPSELRTPIVWIEVNKKFPHLGKTLNVDYKLDIEQTFGGDQANRDDLFEIVANLRERVRQEENRRGN